MTRHRMVPAFLRTTRAAATWAKKNVDTDDDDELWARARTYVDFAYDAYSKGTVTVWRAVKIPPGTTPNLQCLGKAWSYRRGGAGVYGMVPYQGPLEVWVVEGRVRPADIDWEYGFTSFVYYGEEQAEVSMHDHSPVLVTSIEQRRGMFPEHLATWGESDKLDPPLKGMTGTTERDMWRPGCESPAPKARAAWRRANFW